MKPDIQLGLCSVKAFAQRHKVLYVLRFNGHRMECVTHTDARLTKRQVDGLTIRL